MSHIHHGRLTLLLLLMLVLLLAVRSSIVCDALLRHWCRCDRPRLQRAYRGVIRVLGGTVHTTHRYVTTV